MAGGKALGGTAKKAVQRAVQQVAKHDWGQLYFNEAVDPLALGIPDYPTVRPRPAPPSRRPEARRGPHRGLLSDRLPGPSSPGSGGTLTEPPLPGPSAPLRPRGVRRS